MAHLALFAENCRGMMTEAVQEVARFVLCCSCNSSASLGTTQADDVDDAPPTLRRLQITMCTENKASVELARRLGATKEGVLREYENLRGRYVDHVCFSLLAKDFGDPSL